MFTTKDIADAYDQIGLNFSLTRRKLSPEVVSLVPKLPKNAPVLDLGCGNGVLLSAFQNEIDYTGIDISQTLLKEAKRLHHHGNFILADILDPKVWEGLGHFDFIAALAVFHHLPTPTDHDFLLQQINSHLNPGGSILISNWRLLQPKFDLYRTSPVHLNMPFHSGPSRDFYAFTDDELKKKLNDLNFSQTKLIISKDNLYLTSKRKLPSLDSN